MRFIKIDQKLDKEWIDYTSLSTFITCPRKYWLRCLQDITSAVPHPALINGKAYHEGIAAYHKAIMGGATFEEAVDAGLKVAAVRMAEIKVEDAKRNTAVATSTLHNYFERWRNDVSKMLYVEVGGAVDVGDFLYVGLIDAIAETAYGVGIRETKTTTIVGDRWQLRAKPNLQVDGYMFMASVLLGGDVYAGCLDVIPIHEDAKKRKDPFRIMTTRSEAELATWHRNLMKWWKMIKVCKEDGFFPMATDACVPMIGSDCPFHIICKLYPDPHNVDVGEMKLPDGFVKKAWMPVGVD